jgi:hypothetical protein
MGKKTSEQVLDIGHMVERIRNDDKIVFFVSQIEGLPLLAEKGGVGDPGPGPRELRLREVDTGEIASIEPGEQIALSATDFKNRRGGRNDEVVVMSEKSPI